MQEINSTGLEDGWKLTRDHTQGSFKDWVECCESNYRGVTRIYRQL